jgi:hypothetical protein
MILTQMLVQLLVKIFIMGLCVATIGNAVPPVFGWHLAEAIEKFLNTNLG